MSGDTISVYDARAQEYARLAAAMQELPEMEAFAALLPEGARLLDLGCGPGHHAEWFAARGFAVEALDASGEMAALAAARPGVSARQADFADLPASPAFHGIWANFSLLHLPRTALAGQLRRMKRALYPGGLLHLGMKLGAGEGRDRLGRFYTYWGEDELEALLLEAGFTITARRHAEGRGLAGELDRYLLIRAHG